MEHIKKPINKLLQNIEDAKNFIFNLNNYKFFKMHDKEQEYFDMMKIDRLKKLKEINAPKQAIEDFKLLAKAFITREQKLGFKFPNRNFDSYDYFKNCELKSFYF